MKLVLMAADYGMLDCLTDGQLKAFRFGMLKNITFITNNQSAFRAAEELKKFPEISVGQEINFVSGWPITDPKLIPSLVNEDGSFKSSKQRQAAKNRVFNYDECVIECENQLQRFIQLMGKKPLWLSGHSYGSLDSRKAIADVAKKYDLPCSLGADEGLFQAERPWDKPIAGDKAAYKAEMQKDIDVVDDIVNNRTGVLEHEWACLHTHSGYVDEELMKISSYTVIRSKELEAMCSPKVKEWAEKNGVEFATMEEYLETHEIDKEASYIKMVTPQKGWAN